MEYSPENSVSYAYNLKVEQAHIDKLSHVNNVVYLQWVNDISEKHWNLLSQNGLHRFCYTIRNTCRLPLNSYENSWNRSRSRLSLLL